VSRTAHVGSGEPCPRCLPLVVQGELPGRAVMPLNPIPAMNPRSRDDGTKCCADCGAADALAQPGSGMDFLMARVAVANDRMDALLLPGADMGLVQMGWIRPSDEGDLDKHHAWLSEKHLWGHDPNDDAEPEDQ
jgi:hypothetical protein